PQTCKELLETEKCGEVRLIIEEDDHTRSRGLRRNLRVRIEGISENATLHGLTDKVMGLYDVALLCECEQVVDVERGIRHNLTIDASALRSIGYPDGLSDYDRLYSELVSLAEEVVEEMESEDDLEVVEELTISGPEMKLVNVELDTNVRGTRMDVVVHLVSTEHSEDTMDFTVLQFSSEIVGLQALSYEFIVDEVNKSLKNCNVSEDSREGVIKSVVEILEKQSVKISYD
ncbi:MAG: hypothetical protein RTU30_10790, partial [Candidatus Thorarchaeota archaeon]